MLLELIKYHNYYLIILSSGWIEIENTWKPIPLIDFVESFILIDVLIQAENMEYTKMEIQIWNVGNMTEY